MPDEVTLDVTTIEENVTVETTAGDVVEIQVVAPTGTAATVSVGTTTTGAAGTNASVTNSGSTSAAVFNFTIPRGATGEAGPNSVTIATTSDGTANLTLNNVSTASFTAGNSSTTSGEITIFTNGPVFQWRSDTVEYGERGFTFLTTDITSEVNYTLPNASGTLAITGNTNGEPDKLTAGTISGATTFNTTSYTYGTGAAAAHRTALGLTTLATTTPGTNVANFLATPTSDNLASALTDENGTGGGFVRTEGATLTSPSIAGTAAFTGTTRPTSAGTGTPAATSLVTREDLQKEQARTISQEMMVTPAEFSTSTASGGFAGQGQGVMNMVTNLTASAYARAAVTRDIGQYVAAGANAACAIPVAIAFSMIHAIPASANTEYRFVAGEVGTGTPRALGTNPLAGRGFGFRLFWSVANSRREIQVFAHNGSTYVESAATSFGATTDAPIATILLTSDGAGIIKLFLGIPSSPNFERVRAPDSATITLSGGPSNGVYDQPQFAHIVQNASTAPSGSLSVRPSRCLISTGLIY